MIKCYKGDISNQHKNFFKTYGIIGFIVCIMIVSPFLPVPLGMPDQGVTTLAILSLGIVLWLTKIIHPAVTSILIIVLFSLFKILTFGEAASGLGSEIVWLVIIMLSMGIAVEKTGLGRRVTFYLLKQSKGYSNRTSFLMMCIAFLLTFFIPSGMARLTVLLPVSTGLIGALKKEEDANFNKIIILTITYVPWICTILLMTGSNGAIYASGLFERMVDYQWSYLHWMILMLPIIIVTLIGLWLILTLLFPPKQKRIKQVQSFFEESYSKLGRMKMGEKKLVMLYLLLILLWMTKEFHGMSIAMSACLTGVFIFVPGINLLNWTEAMHRIDWGIPLLFAAGLSIASALEKSGVIVWLSDVAALFLIDLSAFSLAMTIMFLFVVIRIGFTHFAAMIASLLPVALTFAIATQYNPVWVGMISVVASSMAYIFPTQSISNMATFVLGYYTTKDMIKAGSLLTGFMMIVTVLFAYFYWPLIGVPIK
ncbi:SLC13 family permease [Virgibacillus sp. DJP39]|uniref:SLC13 family permease n=1 Tax=Virgibacillus sp. DJP39 TaxID=3409790 RepID=UPI003BB7B271